jgi:hypothetical protein
MQPAAESLSGVTVRDEVFRVTDTVASSRPKPTVGAAR